MQVSSLFQATSGSPDLKSRASETPSPVEKKAQKEEKGVVVQNDLFGLQQNTRFRENTMSCLCFPFKRVCRELEREAQKVIDQKEIELPTNFEKHDVWRLVGREG